MTKIAVLPGDGIGPEVTAAAVRVLRAAVPSCELVEAPVGATAIASHGTSLPEETLELAKDSAAILFGAVGGPGFDDRPPDQRPEAALLTLRRTFGLYANVRPARVHRGLEDRSPLREERVRGMDLIVVRELTGGLYYGPRSLQVEDGVLTARDTMVYHEFEIERVARFAFELALTRKRRVTSVDKANVLISSQLWRRTVERVAKDFPDVALDHVLVDNASMQLVREPRSFDVIVTENTFGDILSDEAAMITGTIGTAASASLAAGPRDRGFGLYEPISGTAPDIAGRGIANPTAAILSAGMLVRFSLGDDAAAQRIENAVEHALAMGPWTPDLALDAGVSTNAFTDLVLARLETPVLSDRAARLGV